jgi:hypothetical protein
MKIKGLLMLNGKGCLEARNLLKTQHSEELSMQKGRGIFEGLRRWKRQRKEELLRQIEEGNHSEAKRRGRLIYGVKLMLNVRELGDNMKQNRMLRYVGLTMLSDNEIKDSKKMMTRLLHNGPA